MVSRAFHSAENAECDPPWKRMKMDDQSPDVNMYDSVQHTNSECLESERDLRAQTSIAPPPTSTSESIPNPPRDSAERAISSSTTNMPSASAKCKDAVHDQASKEIACGITEFVCPELLGFTGILKKRYTDFLVNEILPSGAVVHLDTLQAPKKKKEAIGESKSLDISLPTAKDRPDNIIGTDIPLEKEVNPIRDTKPDAAIATPQPASLAAGSGEKFSSGAAASDDTRTRQPSKSEIPASMRGFDDPPTKVENLAPHMRIAPPSSSIPASMRDFDVMEATPKPTRKKQTVRIRRTSQGWVEVEEQKEIDLNAVDDAAVKIEGEDSITGVNDVEMEGRQEDAPPPKAVEQESEIKEQTTTPPPPTTQASWRAFASATSADAEAATGFELNSEDMTALLSHFGPNVANDILALHERILCSELQKVKDYGTVKSAIIDRQTRSKIHQDLRRMFESRLESTTDDDGHMIISAQPEKLKCFGRTPTESDYHIRDRKSGRGRNDRGRGGLGGYNHRDGKPRQSAKSQWAELGGDYLHFSLCKENKDTMEAVSWLAKQLNTKPSAFQFAGTKDRRGVTVQRVSVYRVFADRMVSAGRSLRGAKIGNYEYQPRGLQLGELTGNEFVITLRDCDFHYPMPVESNAIVEAAHSVVGEAIQNLGDNGYLNYYGLQRFGTFSTSTDQVGVKILQGDFEGAVEGILHFDPATLADAQDPMTAPADKISRDDQARAYAINLFKTTGNSIPALHDLPKKFSAESAIIRHLGRQNSGNDYIGAIQSINRNLRLMYVHAYQSLVWNMAASYRWKTFGATVVEGDMVLVDEHKNKSAPEIKSEDVDEDGEAIVRPSEDDRAADPEDDFIRARALMKEEAESGHYTIFDIVLPTPGYDILYPPNEMTKFYEDFMGSERGGGLDPHDMRRKWKDASLSGSYRKLLARPSKDFSFEVKVYNDEDEQFVKTDLDRLEKARTERMNAQHSHSAPIRDDPAKSEVKLSGSQSSVVQLENTIKPEDSPSDHEPGGVSLSGGPYRDYKIAVILKLQLGSSQYATMALRELMKHGGARAYKADFSGGH